LIAGNSIDTITSKIYNIVIYQLNKEFIPLFLREGHALTSGFALALQLI